MDISSQRLNYKIKNPLDRKYKNEMDEKMKLSYTTFNDIQTPGWSSLMKSQISQKNTKKDIALRKNKGQPLTESQIRQRLNRLEEVNGQNTESVEDGNAKVHKNIESFQTKQKYDTRQTIGHNKIKVIVNSNQNKSTNKSKIIQKPASRWNQLTIFEHLYLNSHKRQHQRMIEKQIDEEYKKKQMYPFRPKINQKSVILAESKYQRIKERQISPTKSDDKNETTVTFQEKQSKEVQRYKLLNRTFYFLTQDEQILSKGIQESLQKLPLSCIKTLEPIIQDLYKGKVFEWIDFLQKFNSKAVKNKQSFYVVMKKWFERLAPLYQ